MTTRAAAQTQCGPVIIIMHKYDRIGHVESIHSSGKLERFNYDVNVKYMKVPGGLQCIVTQGGLLIPINIISRLLYMPLQSYTYNEKNALLYIGLASDIGILPYWAIFSPPMIHGFNPHLT